MKKNINLEELENEILLLGDNLAMIESLAKCIDIILEDEITFERQDIENMIAVLRKIIRETKEQYSKIDELLGL